MDQNIILRVALPTPLRRLFDYLLPQPVDHTALIPGIRVLVPFQSRTLVGILTAVLPASSVPVLKLKPILKVLDTQPMIAPDIYQLCQWAADYYHHSLGDIFVHALPISLRKDKPLTVKKKTFKINHKIEAPLRLNLHQQQAVEAICAAKNYFQTFLLDGLTGSGKTEVYLQVIADFLNAGKQILILIPEINLTPQTISRFYARFAVPIFALHSNMSEGERLRTWLAAKSGEAKIVIGTRSAVFTPFAALGLIIIDEEHDVSFKQQDRFRYHARDVAIMRAHLNSIPIVLGSATPSLESLLNAKRARYHYLSLPQRAGLAQLPQYQLVDLRNTSTNEGLSVPLLNAMKIHLDKGYQVLLFLNRRGFSPVLYCKKCAWIAGCTRCDARMVYHHTPPRLQCHHCDKKSCLPTRCQQCGEASLQAVGLGTQRLEQALEQHFADVPIIRVDRDNTKRKGAMQQLFSQINENKKAILLGTQMLAKGHHFPLVTLVGIVDADNGLMSADFRATEQMGQLLLQVAGRAGRVEKPGTVVIQTHQPHHPLLQILIQQGYACFSQALLNERERAILPPFTYLAVFRAEAYQEEKANEFLTTIKEMTPLTSETISVLGPVPALMAKRKGLYGQRLLVRATRRSVLQQFLKEMVNRIEKISVPQSVKWALDVDPIEI